MPGGFIPNGLLSNEATSVGKVLNQNRWSQAEARTAELLQHIQPNNISEFNRNAVVSYIQHLIMSCVPCQVFAFGSVPLKTYLPDGDIDLTTFCDNRNLQDSLIPEILSILESEEKSEDAEFHVKEVQYIQAEVKIIKCLVENFVVDVSFNQLSGLCSLCFFEEVDYMIRRDHLFKRSIILIKAWCYYESRILGSHCGLISTYALEILVLYIFHLYDNKFAGPLEVLYRFLDFYSKFDWDNYCISLRGPVPIVSLPNLIAEPPRKDCRDLLLSETFLNSCSSCYGIKPSSQENQEQPFVSKHMNIIDPLRANNNLGRSINKGSFFRIKSAIAFGAQRIVRLLDSPEENLIAEFDFFFKNTWDRHGNGYWIDARIYNLYVRNSNVERSTCHESEVEQAQASHGSHNIYQKPANHLKESKQMFGTSDVSAVSQPWRSETIGMFTGTMTSDTEHTSSKKNAVTNKGKSPQYSSNEVHCMHQFASVSSSPEFAPIYSEVPTQDWRTWVSENGKIHSASSLSDNIMGSSSSFGQTSYDWRSEDAVNSKNASSSYCYEFGLGVNNESGYYVDEAMGMHHEEHDFVNITETNRSPDFNGYLQAPADVNSSDVSFPSPPHAFAPGYRHANTFGALPAGVPFSESFSGHNMPYSQDVVPLPELQWFPSMERALNQEEITEPVDYNVAVAHLDHERQMAASGGSSSGSSSCKTSSGSYSLKDKVITSEQKCLTRENDSDDPPDVRIMDSNKMNPAASPFTPASNSTSGTNLSSSSFSKGSPPKTSQPDEVSGTDLRESTTAETVASYMEALQITSNRQGPRAVCNSSVPDTPVLVGSGSSQRAVDNQRLSPFAFDSSEKPLPFLSYNLPTETGTTYMDGESSVSLDSTLKHSDTFHVNYISHDATSGGYFVEQMSDTLSGDYESYWLNLQYGRFCQNAQLEGPLFHPSTIIPPMFFRAQRPWNRRNAGFVNVVAHGAPLAPEMPSKHASGSHLGVAFWLPRFSGGTGTYMPNPSSYQQRYYVRKRSNKNQNKKERKDNGGEREGNSNSNSRERLSRQVEKPGSSNCNSREKFSSHGQFYRQVEKPGNSNFNSREMFPSRGQFYYRRVEKPGTNEASQQGEGSSIAVNELANLERDSKYTSPHYPS